MIWGLLVFVAITGGLGILMRKFNQDGFGNNLGNRNNERWGMDDTKKYHD